MFSWQEVDQTVFLSRMVIVISKVVVGQHCMVYSAMAGRYC